MSRGGITVVKFMKGDFTVLQLSKFAVFYLLFHLLGVCLNCYTGGHFKIAPVLIETSSEYQNIKLAPLFFSARIFQKST